MNAIRSRINILFKQNKGQAIVEFALIAPIFIIFLLGMLQIGVIMNYENGVLSAAREGARWGAITGDISGGGNGRTDDIRDEVVDRTTKYIEMLEWDSSNVQIKTNKSDLFPYVTGDPKGGDELHVTVSYPLDPFFPIPTGLLGGDGSNILPNTITIQHTVVTVLEDV